MSNSSIRPIHRTHFGATTPSQRAPGSDPNKVVLRISQRSSITGASSSDCLVSYPENSLKWRSYPSGEKRSVYFAVLADWAKNGRILEELFLVKYILVKLV